MALIADSLKSKRVLVFIDTLEVPPTQARFYAALLEVAQVAGALCKRRRARPLPARARPRLRRCPGGAPRHCWKPPPRNPKSPAPRCVPSPTRPASSNLDMTATLVILFAVVIASRYIARGIGNDELYIPLGGALHCSWR